MQLAGNIFTNVSAGLGSRCLPSPTIRPKSAPRGSLQRRFGFQVSVGTGVHPRRRLRRPCGYECCRSQDQPPLPPNLAASSWSISIHSERAISKKPSMPPTVPSRELGIKAQIVEVPVTTMTKAALADTGLDNKSVLKCRNIFVLGLICALRPSARRRPPGTSRKNSQKNPLSAKPTPKCFGQAMTTVIISTPR